MVFEISKTQKLFFLNAARAISRKRELEKFENFQRETNSKVIGHFLTIDSYLKFKYL